MKRTVCLLLALALLAAAFTGCERTQPGASEAPLFTESIAVTALSTAAPTAAPTTEPTRAPLEVYAGMPGKTIALYDGLTLAVKADGTMLADDADGWRDLSGFEGWRDIVSISTNRRFAAGVRADGGIEALYFDGDPVNYLNDRERAEAVKAELRTVTDAAMISVGSRWVGVLRADGTVSLYSLTALRTADVSDWTDVVSIVVDGLKVYGLKKDGTVMGAELYENDQSGELFQQDIAAVASWENVTSIQAGLYGLMGSCADGPQALISTVKYADELLKEKGDLVSAAFSSDIAVLIKRDGSVEVVDTQWHTDRVFDTSGWTDIVDAACGMDRIIGLKRDGTLVEAGVRGDELLPALEWKDVVQFSASATHIVGLRADGTVVAAGQNNLRQCEVGDWRYIVKVSAGDDFTAALTKDGRVIWTEPDDEMLRHDFSVDEWEDVIDIEAGWGCILGLRKDGRVHVTGILQETTIVHDDFGRYLIEGFRSMSSLSAGGGWAVGMTKSGAAKSVGHEWHGHGELELSGWKDLIQVAVNGPVCLGLNKNGTVCASGWTHPWKHTWGDDEQGAYADWYDNVLEWKNIKAVAAGGTVFAGLNSDGTVEAEWMYQYMYDLYHDEVASWTDAVAVVCAGSIIIVRKNDGSFCAAGFGFRPCAVESWTGIKTN